MTQRDPESCIVVVAEEVAVVQFTPLAHLEPNFARRRFHYSFQGTWGAGYYLAHRDDGPSAAMYGQGALEGVVVPGRTFDARDSANLQIFLAWAGLSVVAPWHPPKRYSLEANAFRQRFGIDTVIFHPDERCRLTNRDARWYLTGPPAAVPPETQPTSLRVVGVLGGVTERFEEDLPANPARYRPMSGAFYSLPSGAARLILGA